MDLNRYNLIKKLNKIFKMGYVPSRGAKDYFALKKGVYIAKLANCFGHACFNLLDEHFTDFDISYSEARTMFRLLGDDSFSSAREVCDTMFDFVRETGLSVEESESINGEVKSNQWKVAMFLDTEGSGDVHFMLREKNGKWSSKMGDAARVQTFSTLPRVFFLDYNLYGIYNITNPYIEAEA